MGANPVRLAAGMMSGTSMDGVDVALVETDGCTISRFGGTLSVAYNESERAVLRRALDDARAITDRGMRPGKVGRAESVVTDRHAEAIEILCAEQGISLSEIDIIGFHGQTVLHRPQARLTVQIGNARQLSSRLGRPVISDFRAADVAAGGQGAPLVPVFHAALAETAGLAKPVAFLNLGGVANITYIGADGELIAFDTGPANALLDDWALTHTGTPVDLDARLAARGQVDRDRLARLMDDPYFDAPPPKSLDRAHFSARSADVLGGLAAEEGAATLAAFTVESVAAALRFLPQPPVTWIVAGGGTRNPVIMGGLEARLGVPVMAADACGFSSQYMEAQAFAYLAVRSLHRLAITFPGTTGAPIPLNGGSLTRP
ncbi:MAG: anhydro-N-acetylmuramic acid kinase [Rhodobiaceae bacterium]|nr:anhydro-N-acetylmuramic acid kinase [Rhodobiaceae bacterium]MCC0016313.1 anhydro-N-acetylmuramic acid kinase [Rhodobiaceae bacterium]MCC0041370.1 anhydro-N-acetylmuramic acid kinase [Rhodobiaceae bacterium]MCC0052655.1 anhydro-N-acetylmuramic acid kinase [Rhodobiaceae bacterium]